MPSSAFSKVAASLFAIVALAHVARVAFDVPIQVGTMSLPMWISWLGLFATGGLSVWGFRSGA